MEKAGEPLLVVHNLSFSYRSNGGRSQIVRSVSFSVAAGEVVGVLGESGSGKTSIALAILGLLPANAEIEGGSIRLGGHELLGLGENELQRIRGKQVSLIFQEPGITLNPVIRVGEQIVEVLRAHNRWSRRRCREEAELMLEQVRLSDVARTYASYPHQLSGGQRQRVAIAQALACKPALVIADEPTASLDATIQAEILELLKNLQQRFRLGFLFISHNPAILQKIAQRVLVLHEGEIVEEGTTSEVLEKPRHSYTRRLLECMPPSPRRLHGADGSRPIPIHTN